MLQRRERSVPSTAPAGSPVRRESSPAATPGAAGGAAPGAESLASGTDLLPFGAVLGYDEDGYPYIETRPLTRRHRQQIVHACNVLERRYADRPDVAADGLMTLHYEEGNRNAFVEPDYAVAFGVRPGRDRTSIKVWEEPAPAFVLEVLSPRTRKRDLGPKRRIYEAMGIAEYWLYDPYGRWMPERLRAYRLLDGAYTEMDPLADPVTPHDGRVLGSTVLGLELHDADGDLRFYDPSAGAYLLSAAEESDARQAAEARAEEAAQARQAESDARQAAEARIAELEALLRRS